MVVYYIDFSIRLVDFNGIQPVKSYFKIRSEGLRSF